jgi:hypothetical protein
MRIGIVGNCQITGLAQGVRSLAGVDVAEFSAAHLYRATGEERATLEDNLQQRDLVFAQEEASRFIAGIEHLTIPYISFNGLQPDAHYVAIGGDWLKGSMGPYISAIMAAAYLEGLSARRTENLFNKYTFSELGYLDAYDLACEEFREHFHKHGYDPEPILEIGDFMHTINHPRADALLELAGQMVRTANLACRSPLAPLEDELGKGYHWPVYPGIADNIGVTGGYDFRITPEIGRTLTQIIVNSFHHWSENDFTSPQIERARAFIRREVR